MKLSLLLRETWEILTSDCLTDNKKARLFKVYQVILVMILFVQACICAVWYYEGDMLVVRDILICMAVFLAVTVFAFVTRNRMITGIMAAMFFLVTLSLCFWYGSAHGSGSYWLMLIPAFTMYLLQMRIGIFCSLYCTVFITLCAFVPSVYEKMGFAYSLIYLRHYCYVYYLLALFSFIIMTSYYKIQLKQKKFEARLERAVLAEHEKVASISLKTIFAIGQAVEAKDEYTSEHSKRVAEYSGLIAEKLGWEEDRIRQLKNIAVLHDIGKIGVRDSILNKPGKLTDEEFEQIKKHTVVGGEILKNLTLIPNVDLGAKYHHERFGGNGYPSGISGTDIPYEARIIGIADSFDAMNSKRIYRGTCDNDYIRQEFMKGRGTQFDPELLDVFVQVCEEHDWFKN